MSSAIATTGSSRFGIVFVGIVFCLYGIGSIVLSVSDFRHWITGMYENNKNRKTGFGAISSSPEAYRRFIGGFGAIFLVIGIVAISAS